VIYILWELQIAFWDARPMLCAQKMAFYRSFLPVPCKSPDRTKSKGHYAPLIGLLYSVFAILSTGFWGAKPPQSPEKPQ